VNLTEFEDLLPQRGSAGVRGYEQLPAVQGATITPAEVQQRLSDRLYEQLSEGSVTAVERAIARATTHVAALYSRLGRVLNLDEVASREVVILYTIYELHLSLGIGEAGKEYRVKARDLILSLYGNYPETDKEAGEKAALGALTVPSKKEYPQ